MSLQKKATIIASFCAFFLALCKLIIGLMSGSIAILSSAIDSMVDFIISAFNFLAIRKVAQKPNENYNFGYGKLEAIMGLIEGCFVAGIGIFIFYQSVLKIYYQEEIQNINIGIFVMLFSLVLTFCLVVFLSYVAKKTKSLIVESDCLHYKSDLLTNFATLLALILIYLTGYFIIDALFGIIASFYIAFSAFKIIKKSTSLLMDVALEENKVEKIRELIKKNKEIISFHHLKTRKSPNMNYLSVHLVFCPIISLYNAHKISDELEMSIRKTFNDEKWDIQIHLDPYDDQEQEETNENSFNTTKISSK